jgi:hypothetical protein
MKKMMNLLAMAIVLIGASFPAIAAEADWPGAILQARLLPPADDPGALAALGVAKGSGPITLADIDGSVIIVEIFSMYCPFCQRHAPATNALYKAIQADPSTRAKVRLLGIGVGNTPYEVSFFKKKYGILFPLFDDGKSQVLNGLKGVRTPYYFCFRKNGSSLQVFFTQAGAFDDPGAFLKTVLAKSVQP